MKKGAQMNIHPLIIRKEDGFFVYSPDLKLGGEGRTLEEAYQKFEHSKQATEENFKKYGLATIVAESEPSSGSTLIRETLGFFVKSIVAAFAFILVIILLEPNINASINNGLRQLGQGFTCTLTRDGSH